jgi:outer membrane lipoprotein-sorting protein
LIKLTLGRGRFWITATTAALLVIGFYIAWDGLGVSSAPAQTAKALQGVKSYRCTMTMTSLPGPMQKSFYYWDASGSVRIDSYKANKLAYISVDAKDKPGFSVDYQNDSYAQLPPARGKLPPLLLMDMARFSDQADRVLPERKIGTQTVKGFEIALRRIDPNADDGTIRVWPDAKDKLPLRVEVDSLGHTTVIEDFVWNEATDKWFDVKPPANFKDATRRFSVEEQTEQIVNGLKTFAKYCGAKYPSVKVVYGDVVDAEMFRGAGLGWGKPVAAKEIRTDQYRECVEATQGFAQMTGIQRRNPDAAYYGMNVGPEDKGKVLFRWKLDDGRYRVIFGDLRAETVTHGRLKELESNIRSGDK